MDSVIISIRSILCPMRHESSNQDCPNPGSRIILAHHSNPISLNQTVQGSGMVQSGRRAGFLFGTSGGRHSFYPWIQIRKQTALVMAICSLAVKRGIILTMNWEWRSTHTQRRKLRKSERRARSLNELDHTLAFSVRCSNSSPSLFRPIWVEFHFASEFYSANWHTEFVRALWECTRQPLAQNHIASTRYNEVAWV